jgi:two-component system, sensor histidine kinase
MCASRAIPTTLSVLIVEDDLDQADLLARELTAAGGFRIQVASDLAGALAAARSDPPGAAVIDIGLPGTDGISVAKALLATVPRRPLLIALTGTAGLADGLFRAGFDRYYLKPADPAALLTTLEQQRAAFARSR